MQKKDAKTTVTPPQGRRRTPRNKDGRYLQKSPTKKCVPLGSICCKKFSFVGFVLKKSRPARLPDIRTDVTFKKKHRQRRVLGGGLLQGSLIFFQKWRSRCRKKMQKLGFSNDRIKRGVWEAEPPSRGSVLREGGRLSPSGGVLQLLLTFYSPAPSHLLQPSSF